jgi:25S rRNA (uracil2843-N3)-methyltransferase
MIRKACMDTFARKDFFKILQAIKQSFVQRDYEGIFTDPVNLAVYTAAYVPGRALCYFEIFCRPQLLKFLTKKSCIYCVGSGSGSELVALSAAMTRVPSERQKVDLIMQDIGDYKAVLDSLESTIRERWLLTEKQLQCTYEQSDVLDIENKSIDTRLAQADLITFMFVMNELFVKKAEAMALIQKMIKNMKKGAHLLVSFINECLCESIYLSCFSTKKKKKKKKNVVIKSRIIL